MNDYSYDEKLEISDFFDDTVPTFPFTVHAPPFYSIGIYTNLLAASANSRSLSGG